jgi:transposase
VFLILDNLPAHHAPPVRAWLDAHHDEIEVFYLPSYSPELNSDELFECRFEKGRYPAFAQNW